jgi:hypothetical protein
LPGQAVVVLAGGLLAASWRVLNLSSKEASSVLS